METNGRSSDTDEEGAEVVPAARTIGRSGEEWRGADGDKGDASGQGAAAGMGRR